ncbi:hypothetical protein HU200_011076 [Digitaria exilis]|uniref:Uncharacterized protein n=1 Tax=Digitaria exilis TaxID=1010633 RepID=A0A835FIJ5_9POAL|nr:hypothetical protein HU200_011076 [Digitaria exilis]
MAQSVADFNGCWVPRRKWLHGVRVRRTTKTWPRVPSTSRYVPLGWRGFWVSLHGQNQGEVVEEGVDFAQDSEVGGGDDFLSVSESDEEISEEISDDFVDVSFVSETKDPSPSIARASPSPSIVPPHSIASFDTNMARVHCLEASAWKDIAGHS